MTHQKSSCTLSSTLLVFLTLLLATAAWGRQKVLYSFTGLADGNQPWGNVARDTAGNLYGTTLTGGSQAGQCESIGGCGVVFELTPNSDGTYTETTIHTFVGGSDGIKPQGTLILDGAGNLYGTTTYGGTGCTGFYNCGTVYELSPSHGSWVETILYNFQSGSDGNYPEAGVIFDGAGNLYGTTGFGANSGCNGLGCGMVFELTPGEGGSWTEQVLYVFQDGTDGAEPGSPLIFDQKGNLYGTAATGGNLACNAPYGCGTVFQLVPGSGGWTENAIYSFDCGNTGCFPSTGVAIDSRGNLFGNSIGGPSGFGFVFRLSPSGGGWKFGVVYAFDKTSGAEPGGTPVFDTVGRLYGTTIDGGPANRVCPDGCGGVFRLAPADHGPKYHFHAFRTSTRGAGPEGGSVIFDSAGNAYGTTSAGGANGGGEVFEIMP